MIEIEISEEIRAAAPQLRLLVMEADVDNSGDSDGLWQLMQAAGEERASMFETPADISSWEPVAATRRAYKALGKEPNRYRPSAQALCRRLVQGKGLYRITPLVDIINLLSLWSGHSIGGFDADKIAGDRLVLGVGRADEEFEAIGRGLLNIGNLPVYRDNAGGIGTPTSDVERTKLDRSTRRLLMIVNRYGGSPQSDGRFVEMATDLFTRFASAANITFRELPVL